jgi:hypothetical protein
MSKPLSQSRIVYMTFTHRAYAQEVQMRLFRMGFYCLPVEEMGPAGYALGFVNRAPRLSIAQQHVLEEFGATDIEMYPLNARHGYENYCHTLYYNDYEAMDAGMEYLVGEDIDENIMVFEEPGDSSYAWRVVFCTEEKIGQEYKDRIMATINPTSWLWNEPVEGEVSPTSIFC